MLCARVSKMVLSHSNSVKFYRCHGLDLGEIRGCITKQVWLSTIGVGILKKLCLR